MLELQGLTRRYGDTLAVEDVSFTVPEGAMVGFGWRLLGWWWNVEERLGANLCVRAFGLQCAFATGNLGSVEEES